MLSPALPSIQEEFGIGSNAVASMIMSTFVLASVVGPIVYAPLSETYGRKHILQISHVAYIVFSIGCGLSKGTKQMIIFRFLCGLASAAPVAIGGGAVADMYAPAHRGLPMCLYMMPTAIGPCIGLAVGGWVIEGFGPRKWRWIIWIFTVFVGVIAAVGAALLPETYRPVILRRHVKALRAKTGNPNLHTIYDEDMPGPQQTQDILLRPLLFLFTQPVVLVPSLYLALVHGCQYILLTTLPDVFKRTYEETPGLASLHYIPVTLGFIVATALSDPLAKRMDESQRSRTGGVAQPEHRLCMLAVSGITIPIGMLVYGWTAQYRVHWIASDCGLFIVGFGFRGVLVVIPLYLADAMSTYAASAISASVSMRSLAGFSFPLFAEKLYFELGQGWGNTVLAL
ncbi:hypothetical protein MSPP1_003763, partial [Malassezia sp. CBS 17886]